MILLINERFRILKKLNLTKIISPNINDMKYFLLRYIKQPYFVKTTNGYYIFIEPKDDSIRCSIQNNAALLLQGFGIIPTDFFVVDDGKYPFSIRRTIDIREIPCTKCANESSWPLKGGCRCQCWRRLEGRGG